MPKFTINEKKVLGLMSASKKELNSPEAKALEDAQREIERLTLPTKL